MNKENEEIFGEDFAWGVSNAALQVEGACDEDGKGQSVWDVFTHRKGKIRGNENADIACDFYHRYREDIAILKDLGIPNFRFSLSWSRIIPQGIGALNEKGIAYYNDLIDTCLEAGIEPWITLYHWDLPQALEVKGGWTNRQVVDWFTEYVSVCAARFGDRVKHWMVMNEPMVFTGAGHFLGVHAPGRKGMGNFLSAAHHAVLAMAEGGRTLRKLVKNANIGSTFSCSYIEPWTESPADKKAATRVDALLNRMFIEPVLGLGYPIDDAPVLNRIKKYIRPGDREKMQFDFDFIGIQNYTREIIRYSWLTPYIRARIVKAEDRNVPLTQMNWEVYPAALYEMIKKFDAYPQIPKLIVTENGAAFPDEVINGRISDEQRVAYLKDHIGEMAKAKQEGSKIAGYFVWTLTDNFEWAEGYHPKFGLVHINFDTQERIVKDSGKWYGDFIASGTAK